MKWSHHRRRRRASGKPVVDRVDQHADAEHVGEENEFVPLFGRELPRLREPVHGGQPLVLLQVHFADKAVQMLDERLHDLTEPRRVARFPAFQGKIG